MHQALKAALEIVRKNFLERETFVDGKSVRPLTLHAAAWQWVTYTVTSQEQGLEYFLAIVREGIVQPSDLGELNDPQIWLEFFQNILAQSIATMLLHEFGLETEDLKRRQVYGE